VKLKLPPSPPVGYMKTLSQNDFKASSRPARMFEKDQRF
jgi:hypothetical protein